MRFSLLRITILISAIIFPFAVSAQVGPCDSTGSCIPASLQEVCAGPAGARQCYKKCDSANPCVEPQVCTPDIEGIRYFSPTVCATPAGLAQSAFTASAGIPCSTDAQCGENKLCVGLTGSRFCYRYCTDDTISGIHGCQTGESCKKPDGFPHEVCGTVPSATVVSTPEPTPEVPFVPITPNLGVQIPGANLSAPTNEGGVVRIAFLAQYINAAYKYLTGTILVVAIVMCVYGGFLYLVGSADIGSIQRGKKIMIDAIMGMVIVLAAYAILNTVNPDTTNLKVLELSFVKTDPYETVLLSTTADTMPIETPGTSHPITTSVTTRCPAGSHAPLASVTEAASTLPISYPGCPVNLTIQATLTGNPPEARTSEFFSLMQQKLSPSLSAVDRVQQIAEAAVKCGIHMGSCGKTAQLINTAAGLSAVGNIKHHEDESRIGGQLRADMLAHKCSSYTAQCTRGAQDFIYDKMRAAIPGWPDSWANDLQPGDKLTLYNANSDGLGFHSALFIGWGSNGEANIVQGQWTCLVNSTTVCLRSSCAKHGVLVRVFKP